MAKFIIITTSCDDRNVLEAIACELVQNRLAACCQIQSPVTSVYRWNETVNRTEEWICTIKTKSAAFSQIDSLIRKLHSYDEPEIIATEIAAGSQSYLNWVDHEVEITEQ